MISSVTNKVLLFLSLFRVKLCLWSLDISYTNRNLFFSSDGVGDIYKEMEFPTRYTFLDKHIIDPQPLLSFIVNKAQGYRINLLLILTSLISFFPEHRLRTLLFILLILPILNKFLFTTKGDSRQQKIQRQVSC